MISVRDVGMRRDAERDIEDLPSKLTDAGLIVVGRTAERSRDTAVRGGALVIGALVGGGRVFSERRAGLLTTMTRRHPHDPSVMTIIRRDRKGGPRSGPARTELIASNCHPGEFKKLASSKKLEAWHAETAGPNMPVRATAYIEIAHGGPDRPVLAMLHSVFRGEGQPTTHTPLRRMGMSELTPDDREDPVTVGLGLVVSPRSGVPVKIPLKGQTAQLAHDNLLGLFPRIAGLDSSIGFLMLSQDGQPDELSQYVTPRPTELVGAGVQG